MNHRLSIGSQVVLIIIGAIIIFAVPQDFLIADTVSLKTVGWIFGIAGLVWLLLTIFVVGRETSPQRRDRHTYMIDD